MKKAFEFKYISFLLGIYFLLFFSIVLPFHHHSDLRSHGDDCVICALAVQPFISNTVSPAQLVFTLLLIIVFQKAVRHFFQKESIHLRSPPVF